MASALLLIGRSSSHFTRVVRIFAAELGVDYELREVRRLLSLEVEDYGGNPALKLPSLRDEEGLWFGTLPLCRRLARRVAKPPHIVWPEDLQTPLASNAQELVVQAMATGVSLILSESSGASPHRDKQLASLRETLRWLDQHLQSILAELPDTRELSFFEVTLFCMFTHLQFRPVMPLEGVDALRVFCDEFSTRASAHLTAYSFAR